MRFELVQWSISNLKSKAGMLDPPSFQRQSDVWDLRRKKLLIDSILKKWRIPKLYLTNVKSDVYGMIDGQQRIGTILEFVNDGFGITSDASGEEYKFSALGQKDQETILNYPLDIEMITDASQEEQSELFSRLQEGMELNTWEKLNAITGKLADFIGYMEKHDFFSKTAIDRKRYVLKGVCQQILYFEANGIKSSAFSDLWEFFDKNREFNDESVKKKAIASLDLMSKIFEVEEPYLSKIGNVLSIYLLCSWLISRKVDIHPQLLRRFFTIFFENLSRAGTGGDRDFSTYNIDLIQPVSDSKFIESRNHILKKHLCLYEPKLIEYLDADETKEFLASMEESFREKSRQIQDLVKEVNDRAIGSGAHKIFTLTGENSGIFTRMSYPIRGEEDYRELVELLWKAFYEGSNSSNKIPNLEDDRAHKKIMKEISVIIKINDLRMVEAHDLEQDPATYETKVKNACMIRDFYTGKKHVRDFNSNDFIIFQYRIVIELFDFMKQLSESFR